MNCARMLTKSGPVFAHSGVVVSWIFHHPAPPLTE